MMFLVITLMWAAIFFWFTRRADKLFRLHEMFKQLAQRVELLTLTDGGGI